MKRGINKNILNYIIILLVILFSYPCFSYAKIDCKKRPQPPVAPVAPVKPLSPYAPGELEEYYKAMGEHRKLEKEYRKGYKGYIKLRRAWIKHCRKELIKKVSSPNVRVDSVN
ncbi:MAG: hypothetical protein D3920_08510 [Candidatus Electrothrix sp. AW2]|nr:hypothetical protein [Candidatus Electrothrix gigas]